MHATVIVVPWSSILVGTGSIPKGAIYNMKTSSLRVWGYYILLKLVYQFSVQLLLSSKCNSRVLNDGIDFKVISWQNSN